jgi:hypothetical protein
MKRSPRFLLYTGLVILTLLAVGFASVHDATRDPVTVPTVELTGTPFGVHQHTVWYTDCDGNTRFTGLGTHLKFTPCPASGMGLAPNETE